MGWYGGWFGGSPSSTIPAPPSGQTFRQVLYARLLSLEGVTDIVGSHVYPGLLPRQHSLDRDGPALTFSVTVDKNMGRGITGLGHHLRGSDGTVSQRVQLSAWSYVFAEADAISRALFAALDGLRNVSWGEIEIVSSVREQEIDLPQAPTGESVRTIYQIASEFHVRNRESTAVRT